MTELKLHRHQLAPGAQMAGYVLDDLIGTGSSGSVWRAHRQSQAVAIKVMNAALVESGQFPVYMELFRTETNALEMMHNESRVPDLLYKNLDANPPYFVMQLVEGKSFAEDIASGTMMLRPVKERLNRLYLIASTLDALHHNGMVHRDIKPSNIRGWDLPYLLDFSIAIRLMDAEDANPGAGTKLYMPPYPELVPGVFNDLFAFALVCYEVIFGRHALYTNSEIGPEMHAVALKKLQTQSWYRAGTMGEAELPIYLQGVDLEALDAIFDTAFSLEHHFYDATTIVNLLRRAISVEENTEYVDLVPAVTPMLMQAALTGEHFTEDAVSIEADHTNHDVHARPVTGRLPMAIGIGIGIVVIAWFLMRIWA